MEKPLVVPDPDRTPRPWLIALLIAVIAVAVFAPSFEGPWIFDDVSLVQDNPSVRSFDVAAWLSRGMWDPDLAAAQLDVPMTYFRPLVMVSYAADWRAGGGSPIVFHATNLVLHGVVSALVFVTLLRWSGRTLGSAIGALLFAVHPTKAESVAWISGRTDPLVTLFMLLAAWGIALRLSGRRAGWAIEIVATILSYGSKELAVVLPLLAAVECWVFLGRPALGSELRKPRTWLLALGPQLAALAVYLAFRGLFLPPRALAWQSHTPAEHAGLWLETWGRLFELLVFPNDLSLYRSLRVWGDAGPHAEGVRAALGAFGLITLLGVALALRRRRPIETVGVLLFIGCVLPVSNFYATGLDTLTSPRFLYLPLLGVALGVAGLVGRVHPRPGWIVATAVVLLLLAARTVVRAEDFASERRFWRYELEKNPNAPTPLLEHARALREDGQPRAALAVCMNAYRESRTSVFVSCTVRLLARLTPDVDRDSLRRLSTFLEQAATASDGTLVLDVRDAHLELPLSGRPARALRRHAASLETDAAILQSRLGNDDRALALAESATKRCPRCADLGMRVISVARAAQRPDLAERWLSAWAAVEEPSRVAAERERLKDGFALDAAARSSAGELAVSLEAKRLSSLGLWGRAYAVLLPHRASIERAGAEPSVTLAEVAYRAGDARTAEATLAGRLPAPEARALLSKWAEEVPFRPDRTAPPPD